MRRFFYSLCFFFVILMMFSIPFVGYYDYYGEYDWAYKRFLNDGERSLVIGTSRAAQGIHPEVIYKELRGNGFNLPIYNFSFSRPTSPYGEVYYNAIKKKISDECYTNGLFVVSVDPWSLSDNGDSCQLQESKGCLSYVNFFMRPNLQYIYKNFKQLSRSSSMRLHDDGWLEVDVPMDSASVAKRMERKKIDYQDAIIEKSHYRLSWLAKTIDLLKKRGTVVLCRIPADEYFIDMENKFWPSFEIDMEKLADKYSVKYISFINTISDYRTTDGNHLFKEDGERFTRNLCDSIKLIFNLDK